MSPASRILCTVVATASMALSAHAQQSGTGPQGQPGATSPRPANTTKNLPSDTGSQTTLPSGAVTGAGQPQGTGRQPDVGAPGGLERRARAADRATTTDAERRAPQAGATGAEPATGAVGGTERRRPPRASKG